ncbi:MAG: DsbA family protein [Pseudomonadales bacterium]|nr:DsbA family protein [Pseudomonadales bacterium]
MNKREAQRLKREQKQQAAEKNARRNKLIWRSFLFVGVPMLLFISLYAILSQGPVYSPVEISPEDHARGNPDGVKLVVYADFQCPACATEHLLMAQAWPRISAQTQMVFRHYPLSNVHPHAWTAASYAEAAGRQGKFWEMYDMLFVNQAYWSTLSDVNAEFEGYLQDLDLDIAQAREDIGSAELLQKIRNDQRGGTLAGVRGTPTVFLDGRLIPTPASSTELIRLIQNASEG